MRAWLATLLTLLSAVVGPATARAQPDDDQPLPGDATADIEGDSDRTYAGHWWGDLAFYTGDESEDPDFPVSVTVLAPTFGGMYKLPTVPLAFEARVGLVTAFVSAEGADTESTARLANPMLAAYWADRFGRVDVRAGLGFALPLATTRDSATGLFVDYSAYGVIGGANGLWDVFRWVPDTYTLLIPVAAEARIGEHLVLGGEAGLHFLFATDTEPGEDGSETVLQLGAEVAYRARSTRTGIVLHYVDFVSTEGRGDSNQVSIEPYLRFEMAPAFFRVALTMNLDRPYGFSFESGPERFWALHVGGGTQF